MSNKSVQAIYNKAAQNAMMDSRQVQEFVEMASRLLLGKNPSDLTPEDQRNMKMVAAAAINSFGTMLGAGDAGAETGMIYQGLVGSSRIAARRSVGGRLGGPTLSMQGHDPATLVAAYQTQRIVDEYVNGNANRFTPGAWADGLKSETASGFAANWLRARGGLRESDMRQYSHSGRTADAMKMRAAISTESNMSQKERARVDTDIMTAHYMDRIAKQKFKFGYTELDEKQKEQVRNEVKRLSQRSEKEQQAEHRETLLSIEEEYYNQLKAENPTMSDAEARDKARTQRIAMSKSGSLDVSDEGLDAAVRSLEGRTNYTSTTHGLRDDMEEALEGAKKTLAEMTDIFGTSNFDELNDIAKQFGATTLTSAEGARKMRDVMASAKARAASTGRTLQDVMMEYQSVAVQGAAIYGGEGFVPASFYKGYNDVQNATSRNRAAGIDRRTDAEIAAAHNVQAANDVAHYTDVVVAIDLSEQNGDGKMSKWKQRLMEQENGGRVLTDSEINAMKSDARRYMLENASHMTADQKARMFADSDTTNLLNGFQNKRRDGFAQSTAHSMIRQWTRSGEKSAQYRELLSDNGAFSHLGSVQERANAVSSIIENSVSEFGGDVGRAEDFLSEGGEMDEGIARHGGDVEAYIKEEEERMRAAGVSEGRIKKRIALIRQASVTKGEARRQLLSSIATVQQQEAVRNTVGAEAQDEQAQREAAQLEAESRDKTRGVVTKAAAGDFMTYINPETTSEASALAAMYTIGRGEGSHSTTPMFVDAEGNLQGTNINATARMDDEELLKLYGSKENAMRAQKQAGNMFAFSAGENGGYDLEKAKADVTANLEEMRRVDAILADPNATDEQKAAARRKKEVLTSQQAAFKASTGVAMSDFVASAEKRGLTDQSFHQLVTKNAYRNGKTVVADDTGNAVVLDDNKKQREINETIAEDKQLEFLEALGSDTLTALGFNEADQADLKLLKSDDSSVTDAMKASARNDLLNKTKNNKELKNMIKSASTLGLDLKQVENLDNQGNPTGSKRVVATAADGSTAFDLSTKNGRLDMMFEAAKQEGPEAIQALVTQAKAGDKDALAMLNRQSAKRFGYIDGETYKAFDYDQAYKALSDKGLVTGDESKAVKQKSAELKALAAKMKQGTASAEEIQRAGQLQRELDKYTKGARTAVEGSAQHTALQSYAMENNKTADEMFNLSAATKAEQAAFITPEEQAEIDKQDQEQTRDMTAKVISLCEMMLKTITPEGKIKVKDF